MSVLVHVRPRLQLPLALREALVPMICRRGSELRQIVEFELGDRTCLGWFQLFPRPPLASNTCYLIVPSIRRLEEATIKVMVVCHEAKCGKERPNTHRTPAL